MTRKTAVVLLTVTLIVLIIAFGCRKHPAAPPTATAPAPRQTTPTPRAAKPAATKATCDYCPVPVDPSASTSLSSAPSAHTATIEHVSRRRAQHSCTVRIVNTFPVPDPTCTPGAFNPTVTLAVLQNSLFRTGCIRNCVSSESQKAATYDSYGIAHPTHNQGKTQTCELDHLVPLELGGADTLDNIWPQCGPAGVSLPQRFFKQKDLVENYLAVEVKNGSMDLSEARIQIARDWTQYLDAARAKCATVGCR
jgi:hypothetical protein